MALKELKPDKVCPACDGVLLYVGVRNATGDLHPIDEEHGIYRGYRCLGCGRNFLDIPGA